MAFEILAKLGLNATGFQSGLKRAESQASVWGRRLRGSVTAQLSAAFGGAALVAGAKKSIERAGNFRDEASSLGITAERYQELGYAAKQAGSDIVAIQGAIRGVAKAQAAVLQGGDKKALSSFEELGVSLEQIKSLQAPQLFDEIAKAQAGTAVNTEKMNAGMAVLGKHNKEIWQIMISGISESAVRARELGIILGEETVEDLAALGDSVTELQAQFDSGFSGILNSASKFVMKFLDVFEATATGIRTGFDAVKDVFDDFFNKRIAPEDFSKKFFDAAKSGFKQGFEVSVEADVQEEEKKRKDRERKRDALRMAMGEPIEFEDIKTGRALQQPQVNQLQRIGAQVNGTPKTETLLKEQLMIQKKIERNTANKAGEVIPA